MGEVIKEADDPAFFRFITDGNLLRQFDFLKKSVADAIGNPLELICKEVICEMNKLAVDRLCENPGTCRKINLFITNSQHAPPEHQAVEGHFADFVTYLHKNWETASAIHLAAYTLWRLCWIHPFEEGNGRTSRATSYLVLCAKLGMWLPGTNTIYKQIRAEPQPYYNALAVADNDVWKPTYPGMAASDTSQSFVPGTGLAQLEQYIEGLLVIQLSD